MKDGLRIHPRHAFSLNVHATKRSSLAEKLKGSSHNILDPLATLAEYSPEDMMSEQFLAILRRKLFKTISGKPLPEDPKPMQSPVNLQ